MSKKERLNETIGFINYEALNKAVQDKLRQIDPEDAAKIRDNYNRFLLTPRIVNSDGDRIRGFTFTKEDIEMAMYGKVQETPDTNLEVASGMHVSFAYHDGTIESNVVGYTTVLYGIGANGLLNDIGRVRDYSKPCPPDANCPQNAK